MAELTQAIEYAKLAAVAGKGYAARHCHNLEGDFSQIIMHLDSALRALEQINAAGRPVERAAHEVAPSSEHAGSIPAPAAPHCNYCGDNHSSNHVCDQMWYVHASADGRGLANGMRSFELDNPTTPHSEPQALRSTTTSPGSDSPTPARSEPVGWICTHKNGTVHHYSTRDGWSFEIVTTTSRKD